MIITKCPRCGEYDTVPDSQAGKTGTCPKCGYLAPVSAYIRNGVPCRRYRGGGGLRLYWLVPLLFGLLWGAAAAGVTWFICGSSVPNMPLIAFAAVFLLVFIWTPGDRRR